MKQVFLILLIAILTGCAYNKGALPSTQGKPRIKLNQQMLTASELNTTKKQLSMELSIQDALTQHVPEEYKVTTSPDVDIKALIFYDNSTSWIEALGKGMSEANIELVTNFHKKTVTIKRSKLSLLEAIDLLLPNDYTVFTDANVNQNTLMHFDTRKFWVEALNSGTAETGIELTINFSKKIIYLTSSQRDVSPSLVVNNKVSCDAH